MEVDKIENSVITFRCWPSFLTVCCTIMHARYFVMKWANFSFKGRVYSDDYMCESFILHSHVKVTGGGEFEMQIQPFQ